MCSNYAFEPSPRMICIGLMVGIVWFVVLTCFLIFFICMIKCQTLNILQTPPPLCDFEQRIRQYRQVLSHLSANGTYRCTAKLEGR